MVGMTTRLCILASILSVAFLGGCGGGGEGAKCVPGLTIECPCATGQNGSQTCTSSGIFAACVCATPMLDAGSTVETIGPITSQTDSGSSAKEAGGTIIDLDSGIVAEVAQTPITMDSGLVAEFVPEVSAKDAPGSSAVCGDGVVTLPETCDDGNTFAGDGCSSTCKIEPGFDCTGSPSTCNPTVCGNGKKEAGETCDDGNTLPYDGCASNCQSEPKCGTDTSAVGACKSTCGDGILWRGIEDCDDGNVADGDGCSHDCKIEKGWTCTSDYDNPPASLTIPLVARDFQDYQDGTPPTGHPDFGHYCCDDSLAKGKGILASTLGLDRKPVWAGPTQDPVPDPTQILFTGKKEFDQWYRDVSGVNMTYYESMTLLQSATNKTTYAMNSDTDTPWYDLCGFFPLDDLTKPLLDQNTGKGVTYHYDQGQLDDRTCHAYQGLGFGDSWANHNFFFTTEQRYWFQYEGNENLEFTSSDDVWVFINGTMAVEMPGTHNRAVANLVLDASNGTAQVTSPDSAVSNTNVDLKLTIGSVYEVDVFHAQRWCCGSNFMVTMANFLAGRSECQPM